MSASLPSSIYELNYNGELAYKYWIFSADVAFRHSSPQHSQSDTSADANNALELSADVSYNRRILTNTSLSAGVTLTEYIGPSISRVYPLPRISIATDISGALSISLRAGALAQFSHLIKESDSGLPANFWINADNVFKPQHSWYGAIGASGKLLNGYLSYNVEAYCRSIRNLPEFTGCILNMANGGYRPLDDVMQGNGRSYGVKAMVADIEKTLGPVDILVNNAGIIKRVPMHEMPAEDFRQVIDIDLVAPYICAKAVLPSMMERRKGKIINICSMMSELGRETVSAYAAAKGGLKMLTRNIASEYGEYNIQCNGIGPGYIATPQTAPLRERQADGSRHPFDSFIVAKTPAARWGTPEDLMGPVVFLASEASDFINGHVLYVDGGILAYIGKQPK